MEAETLTTKNEAADLLQKLSEATETKIPGDSTKPIASSFWETSESDFETPEKKPEVKTETENKAEKSPKLTEQLKKGSARTAVNMLDFTNKALLTPVMNYKLKKKLAKSFTEKQIEIIENANEEDADETEKKLFAKLEKIIAKHTKKIDAIPFQPEEKEDLESAFYNYFDYTETALSPGWYLGLAITNTMGKRIIDVITD
jgi:hypothetical protein